MCVVDDVFVDVYGFVGGFVEVCEVFFVVCVEWYCMVG